MNGNFGHRVAVTSPGHRAARSASEGCRIETQFEQQTALSWEQMKLIPLKNTFRVHPCIPPLETD
jgi:hypothetical protein